MPVARPVARVARAVSAPDTRPSTIPVKGKGAMTKAKKQPLGDTTNNNNNNNNEDAEQQQQQQQSMKKRDAVARLRRVVQTQKRKPMLSGGDAPHISDKLAWLGKSEGNRFIDNSDL
eukprot:g6062.t1